MKNMKKWISAAFCAAAATGLVFLLAPAGKDEAADGLGARAVAASPDATRSHGGNAYAQATPAASWFDVPPPGSPAVMVSPLSTMSPPQFAADSRGKLVLNGETHANVEKLLLEQDPATLQANLEKATSKLPPAAAADLKVLLGQYQQYSKALPHSLPPDHAPETAQEALKQLDHLHALRVSYLGVDATRAMFGQEEAVARQLIGLMAAEKDPNLTLQQKAERAQDVLRNRQPPEPPAG
jgi:hypothetical protein